ncbi:YbaN family protein [Xanthobacter autotrophicus]|uniref:YbaN family protein n=1 Tax=Xanthobacter TaxID=279 RepID=UPI0024AB16DC|nr:YbaN family protein [Xanthobacter autotrophicus]MDI4663829.1 YbaN family protein [Xanthobacter autotrophicus]
MTADSDTSGALPPTGRPHRSEGEQLAGRWSRAAIYRKLLFAAGIVFLVIGAIGMVVPMLPGTVFLILAAWCFTRSSPRFEAWLLNHRWLGPGVVRWRETGAIPPLVKLFALSSFVGTWTGSWYFGAPTILLAVLGVVFIALTVFVASRPNH